MQRNSNLNNPRLTTILFAVMVDKLGGSVTITQEDIDRVAYKQLAEEGHKDGSISFNIIERKQNG